ncbi:uncharacterized protein LOC119426285, partial [Nematolebias whitei]|uniref:uncharacterized protein LOC119426285 n=1 Tax=Nematolebias whitei TaxID=451745 RepID=UPI0018984140
MRCSLYCQVCSARFFGVSIFKKHLCSSEHVKKMKDIFPQGAISNFVPHVVFMDLKQAHAIEPVVGLSLLTLCFSPRLAMYLCHVCEQCVPLDRILNHIFSSEHCISYFSYTNPDVLSFSWIPQMIMKNILRPKLKQEGRKPDLQALQIFQLTEQLMDRLLNKTYSEVMQTLSENKNLFELFKDFQAKRITIQNYQNDTYRKQPLLGMQHIIECARVGPCESKHYLCTLCGLPVANHMIINHIISFDHIYSYFKAWHPSTLQSKLSYRNYNLFVPTILNFAKLAEKIHETQHASMKQVRLQPDEFQLVNFTCYSEALEKLESITKSSLKTSVTPGHKIEYDAVFSPPKPFPKSHNLLLRCQNCCHDFESMPYLKHLSQPR